eukprot:649710-Pleurochrysis_carterae.AAC.1
MVDLARRACAVEGDLLLDVGKKLVEDGLLRLRLAAAARRTTPGRPGARHRRHLQYCAGKGPRRRAAHRHRHAHHPRGPPRGGRQCERRRADARDRPARRQRRRRGRRGARGRGTAPAPDAKQ